MPYRIQVEIERDDGTLEVIGELSQIKTVSTTTSTRTFRLRQLGSWRSALRGSLLLTRSNSGKSGCLLAMK